MSSSFSLLVQRYIVAGIVVADMSADILVDTVMSVFVVQVRVAVVAGSAPVLAT